ncbi:MAG: patatin-like phospholipase family protein [Ignavibacterium album]|uniref:patatin-like phospholipase family protein n=1 Tax=Ignavibacterium album TaxID=591197 RepID=UPI0026ED7994|nr:patatin-like phospholipase family protein [Ignavibacterium album]MBI5660713.1 patatin-like phospholipase family protein [Ignavibacterium album]
MSKLGLALGGGGARGLAHIGVLKVLEQNKIEVHSITGCSMGAVIGGLYSFYGNAKLVEDFTLDIIHNPKFPVLGINKLSENHKADKNYFEQFFDYVGTRVQALRALNRLSYFDEQLTEEIYNVIPDVPVEKFKIKFSAIATDLLSGEEINFTEGSLRKIIRASSAIPGIFPPVRYNDFSLIDGSASESVPAAKVRELGADRVLAVDVTRELKIIDEPKNVFEILYRAEDISSYHLSMLRLKEANLVISPDVKNLHWTDFDEAEKIIATGEMITKDNLDSILNLYRRNSFIVKLEHKLKKIVGEI